jgi:hypothetical protein
MPNEQLEEIITEWMQEKLAAKDIDVETAQREIAFSLGAIMTTTPMEVILAVKAVGAKLSKG